MAESTLTDIATTKPAPTTTVGVGGAVVFGGYLQSNEKDQRLTGTAKYLAFSEAMVNTAIVGAGVRYFLNLIAKGTWTAAAADDTPEAIEKAELVEEMMADMVTPWRRVIRRAAMYRFHGFSIQEWTAKVREDGIIGMADVAPRPQVTIERWDLLPSGEVIGVVQLSPQTQDEIYIPRSKVIHVVDDSLNDTPEGLGLLRHVIKPVSRLVVYEQLEGFGFESDLRGIPVGRMPILELQKAVNRNDITEAQKNEYLDGFKTFLKSHVRTPETALQIDSAPYRDAEGKPSSTPQWSLELLKAGTTSQPEMGKAISRVNREIARILNVEQLLLGDGAGSHALSKDKTDALLLTVNSALSELVEVFQSDWLGPIWRLNGWDEDTKPKLVTDEVQLRDAEMMSNVLEGLARAGAMLAVDDEAINAVRTSAGMPPQPEQTAADLDASLLTDPENPDDPNALDEPDPEALEPGDDE